MRVANLQLRGNEALEPDRAHAETQPRQAGNQGRDARRSLRAVAHDAAQLRAFAE
jgi:hypothetical protein